MVLRVEFFTTAAGRRPAQEFLDSLEDADRAYIVADIVTFATRGGFKAPVSAKPIKGHKPMIELRTGGLRSLFAIVEGRTMWILHVCKKQDQVRGIVVAAARMKELLSSTRRS